MTSRILRSLLLLAAATLAMPATARPDGADLPDQAELGRDSAGNPCLATRFWDDPAVHDPFAASYSMTCRGATASRHLGLARRVRPGDAPPLEAPLACGEAAAFTVPSLGSVRSRRCFDRVLGLETVETELPVGGRVLLVSAIPTAQGPAEELLRLLAGNTIAATDRGRTVTPAVDVGKLAASPAAAGMIEVATDTNTAMQEGLRYIRAGQYMEASRILNDALSRLPGDAPVKVRVEILLASALADSNLRFFDSASDYFHRADALLEANPGVDGAAELAQKRRAYGALDLLNRRSFADAVGALQHASSQDQSDAYPLLDAATVRMLNRPSPQVRGSLEGMVATTDVGALSQLVIDAQAAWARSVALLAQNQPAAADAALDVAQHTFETLQGEKIDQRQVRWLEARIERQRARLLLREGDRPGAVAALDKAIVALGKAEGEGLSGPTLAETQLERAGVIAHGGGDPAVLLANFDTAVNSLIASDSQGAILPPAIEQYLDLLVADAAAHPGGLAEERFFRALQAVGDPAIARQFVALQSVVTQDPGLAAKVQDQADLEREITRIRFAIDATPPPDAASLAALNTRRAALESQLVDLNTQLQSNRAYGAVNDAPVTLAELRQVLRPGEAYFKLSRVRNYVFGLLVDAQGTQIYRVKNPDIEIEPLADAVRNSIDGEGEKLPIYKVSSAYALFRLIAGPVADRLLAAHALIVDANGPLQKLPIGVLVPDKESVAAYTASRNRAPYDYTMVKFLAARMSISTALSPRSLLVSRGLPESGATLPFIGFAQHMPAPITVQGGDELVAVGSGCETERRTIAALTRELPPIDARELDRATQALGVAGPRDLVGAAFTDSAVKALTDLDQFQVLHFATHGVTEGEWGCSKSPPALVTSLAPGNSDALLSFDEIARLRLDANLVVLSACDTAAGISTGQARATGQEEAGATLEGLVRAFLAANARAVMSTYWPISNAGESEDLIADFYRTARTGTIGDALRAAQVTIMANPKSSHPLFWGAFFIVGDAQKPLLTGRAKVAVGGAGTATR